MVFADGEPNLKAEKDLIRITTTEEEYLKERGRLIDKVKAQLKLTDDDRDGMLMEMLRLTGELQEKVEQQEGQIRNLWAALEHAEHGGSFRRYQDRHHRQGVQY
jgi:hypothetical protein